MDNYKVSVIVPVYNVKEYLSTAIDSLVNQTIGFENIQVIIVDDCSTDRSKEIIMEYEKKFDNIFAIYRKENSGGAGVPRNDAFEYVKSDYIMFLDPDDYYEIDCCEISYNKITTNNVDLVIYNAIYYNDGKKTYDYYFEKEIDEIEIKSDNPIKQVAVWRGIHKREIIEKNNIRFPNCIGEDAVFSIEEWMYIKNAICLNKYFGYVYRVDDNSHSSKTAKQNIEKIRRQLCCYELSMKIARSHNREDVANRIIGHQIWDVFYKLMENESSFKLKRDVLNKVYDFQKNSNLIISNSLYKIAILLTKHRLFNLTLAYLSILKVCKHSNLIKSIYRKVVLRV